MKHASDDTFKKSSCPGCGGHIPSKRGMNQAKYRVETEDLRNLNGMKPDHVLALAGTAIQFWYAGHTSKNSPYPSTHPVDEAHRATIDAGLVRSAIKPTT